MGMGVRQRAFSLSLWQQRNKMVVYTYVYIHRLPIGPHTHTPYNNTAHSAHLMVELLNTADSSGIVDAQLLSQSTVVITTHPRQRRACALINTSTRWTLAQHSRTTMLSKAVGVVTPLRTTWYQLNTVGRK